MIIVKFNGIAFSGLSSGCTAHCILYFHILKDSCLFKVESIKLSNKSAKTDEIVNLKCGSGPCDS